MHISLLRAITNGVFAMERNSAESFFPVVERILQGDFAPQPGTEHFETFTPFFAHVEAHEAPIRFLSKRGDNLKANEEAAQVEAREMDGNAGTGKIVAVIPIIGPIIKYSESCGQTGTETMAQWIRNAAGNPQVEAIVLQVDGPGGQANAVQNISRVIQEANQQKPVLVSISGMAASASYWIASNGLEVYASDSTDNIGSIGTFVSLVDMKGYYAMKGLDIKEFYATKSTKKNKLFADAISGEEGGAENLIQNFIDPFNESFIGAVSANRPKAKESVFTGEMFFADQAKKLGLIDGIKSLDQVILRASQLARKQATANSTRAVVETPAPNSKSDMKVKLLSGMTALLSFFGATVAEGAESVEHEITPEALEEMNTRLSEAAELADQLKAAQSDYEATTAQLKTANTRITELEAIVAQRPAAGTTTAIKTGDDKGQEATEEKKVYSWDVDRQKALEAREKAKL